jgi:ribosomal protein S18 acetylase RimI-like enzyme
VLEQAAGLTPRALQAIDELERRVVAADGGRLKLEWGRLRARSGDRVEDLLWWEGDRLLGFLGLYRVDCSLELAGMVAPDARRRGIGTALLDAAAPLYRGLGFREALLIVPRASVAGKHLALRRDAVLDHSEHALLLSGSPSPGPHDPALILRQATARDLHPISSLLELVFGQPAPADFASRLESPHERTLVIELRGSAIGTLRLTRDGDAGRVFAFAIEPSWQGRGFGRDALRCACQQLRAEGVARIGLEVAVDNDRALALYTSLGFMPVATEDYFALPLT